MVSSIFRFIGNDRGGIAVQYALLLGPGAAALAPAVLWWREQITEVQQDKCPPAGAFYHLLGDASAPFIALGSNSACDGKRQLK